MALFHSSLFPELRQSLQNVTVYTSEGRQILKSKSYAIRNPRTLPQMQARLRFRTVVRLLPFCTKIYPLGFPAPYTGRSRDAFVRTNIPRIQVGDDLIPHIDYENLAFSAGPLEKPRATASFQEEEKTLTVRTETQKPAAFTRADDRIYLVACCYLRQSPFILLFPCGSRSSPGAYTFRLPSKWEFAQTYAYVFACSANRKKASDTACILHPSS